MSLVRKLVNGEWAMVWEGNGEFDIVADARNAKADAESARDITEGYRDETQTLRNETEGLKDQAATKASESEGFRNEAEGFRNESQTQAGIATTKAGEAQGFRNESLTFRDQTEVFKNTTLDAKTSTEEIFNQFSNQYLGPKTEDPAVDNDGNPLDPGDFYFNTVSGKLRWYTGAAFVDPETVATTAANTATAQASLAAAKAAQAEVYRDESETARDGSVTAKDESETARDLSSNYASLAQSSANLAADNIFALLPEIIELPPFLSPLPFELKRIGDQYLIDPSFNLEEHVNISGITYWVDSINGNDSNPGTEAQPFKTLSQIATQGNADVVYIKEGSYFFKNQRPTDFGRSIKVIGLGTNKPVITSDVTNTMGSFSAVSNYYQASSPDFVAKVWDWSNVDENGLPEKLTQRSSVAEVDNNPGSFYWSASTIYVRTSDSRAIDADIKFYDSLTYRFRQDNMTQFFKNIEFRGGSVQLYNNSANGGAKSYLENVHVKSNIYPWGLEEFMAFNVYGWANEDILNYDARNGIATKAVEYNCNISNFNNGSTTGQASTGHNGCEIIRINGFYYNTSGQNIADVTGCKVAIYGSDLSNSTTGVSYECQSSMVHLERIKSQSNATAIRISGGSAVTYRSVYDLDSGAVDVISGTYQPKQF